MYCLSPMGTIPFCLVTWLPPSHATSSRKASLLLLAKSWRVIWLGSLSGMGYKLHEDKSMSILSSRLPGAHNRAWLMVHAHVSFPQGVMSGDWPPRASNGAGAPLLFILFPGLSRTLPRRELVLRKSPVHLPSADPTAPPAPGSGLCPSGPDITATCEGIGHRWFPLA